VSSSLVDATPRTLGSFSVGALAFGCWRLTTDSTDDARALIETAIDAGMNLIDNADVYGLDWGGRGFGDNEVVLGKVLAAAPELRDRMVLATKGGIKPPTPYDSTTRPPSRPTPRSIARRPTSSTVRWGSRVPTSPSF
jgi:aryl-alcohol dehydrogenase-like predicted oxidoreductase